jgi:hypothetical protein
LGETGLCIPVFRGSTAVDPLIGEGFDTNLFEAVKVGIAGIGLCILGEIGLSIPSIPCDFDAPNPASFSVSVSSASGSGGGRTWGASCAPIL